MHAIDCINTLLPPWKARVVVQEKMTRLRLVFMVASFYCSFPLWSSSFPALAYFPIPAHIVLWRSTSLPPHSLLCNNGNVSFILTNFDPKDHHTRLVAQMRRYPSPQDACSSDWSGTMVWWGQSWRNCTSGCNWSTVKQHEWPNIL